MTIYNHYIYTETGIIISNNSVCELDDLSINIPKSYSFFIPEHCVITCKNNVIITSIDENGNITCGKSITCTANSSMSVLFESPIEGIETIKLDVTFTNNETLSFKLVQKYVEVEDRLIVLCNNYGIQLTSDWMHCFYDADNNEANEDMILKNRKMSEFLLSLMELVGLRGSYKTLFSAVSYFGYNNIVWFEEHWIYKDDHSHIRMTTINNTEIERQLTVDGYTKIGDMSMFYALDQLDPNEPYDEGGLPQYVKNYISFDDLYYKLLLLRSVLEKWFIPHDVRIIDIVGEMHGVAGFKNTMWEHNDIFINQDEEQRYKFIDIEYDGTITRDGINYAYMTEEKMIVNSDLYTVSNDIMILNQTDTAHIKYPILSIEKLGVDEIIDLNDFDIITRFVRGDVAIINPKINLTNIQNNELPYYINGFKIRLMKINDDNTQEIIYVSKLMDYDKLLKSMRLGVTILGQFELSISVFDCWGYCKTYPTRFVVTKDQIETDFLILRPSYKITLDSGDFVKRFMQLNSTHETYNVNGVPVIDAVSKNWDINNPDEITNTIINRRYTVNYKKPNYSVSIKKMGNIQLNKLKYVPLNEYWSNFWVYYISCLTKGAAFKLKKFDHDSYIEVKYINECQFLHDLIEESKNPNSPFSYFDFDIQLLNSTNRQRLLINENVNANQILMVYAKIKDFTLDNLIYRIEVGANVLTNEIDKITSIYERNTGIVVYKNRINPSLGADALLRLNFIYNNNNSELGRFILYNNLLTLYDKPLSLIHNSNFKNPNINVDEMDAQHLMYTLYNSMNENVSVSENVDYHIKLRIGDLWFNSIAEYGKPTLNDPTQFETDPLTFNKLKTMLDQYDPGFNNELGLPQHMLDTLQVYYADSTFVIQALNGYDIEILHMNLGHKISTSRIGSINKMYISTPGSVFQVASLIMAIPNEEVKFNNVDISWKINETFTKKEIYSQDGYMLKWLPFNTGIYDITMQVTDKVSRLLCECKKLGSVLIQ